MPASAPRHASCSARTAVTLGLVLIGGLLQLACNNDGWKDGFGGGSSAPAARVIIDEASPLNACFPANATTARTIRLYNTGSADFVVDTASFVCSAPGGGCAAVGVDPITFTVRAGDAQGVQVTLSITCPDVDPALLGSFAYGEPVSGTLTFSDGSSRATASLVIDSRCTTDVTVCCLATGWCCPSTADPKCSEFTDPVYHRACAEVCCAGSGPGPAICTPYDFP